MKITRKLDTSSATYDLQGLTDDEFNTLVNAYQHYMVYRNQALPYGEDSMWSKMQKLTEDRITIV